MDAFPTYAVVPSCGRAELGRCLETLSGQVDGIVVVANGEYAAKDLTGVTVVHDLSSDRNISRWWNLGLDTAECLADAPAWNALVVNDDVVMGPGSVHALTRRMRERGVSLAYPGPWEQLVKTETGPRITGWCFSVPGEDRLRADPAYVWWCGDNDLDLRARSRNGSLMVQGVEVKHTDPNGYTNRIPELSAQAGRDVETFRARWGRQPY